MIFLKKLIKISLFFSIFFVFIFSAFAEQSTAKVRVCGTAPCEEVSTTTPPVSVPVDASATGIPAILPGGFNISVPVVSVTGNGASIYFVSSVPVKYYLYFGETKKLEMGIISQTGVFSMEHQILIPSLYSDKEYFYKIELVSERNSQKMIGINFFKTLPIMTPIVIPTSIEDITFSYSESSVDIKWSPLEDRDNYVRIVRSHKFYPLDIYDGVSVYEGKGNYFSDSYKREKELDYYYSVFVCDKRGVCSFGQSFKTFGIKEKRDGVTEVPTMAAQKEFKIDEIKVFSNVKEVIRYKDNYYVDSRLPVKISLKSSDYFADIKSIIVSLSKTGDPEQSYLTKYNEKRGIFETSPFYIKDISSYVVSVKIYDSKGEGFLGSEFVLNSIPGVVPPVNYCESDWYSIFICYLIITLDFLFALSTILLFYILYKI